MAPAVFQMPFEFEIQIGLNLNFYFFKSILNLYFLEMQFYPAARR